MLLEAKELIKQYTRGGSSFSAVDGVSLTVNPGDFICITGKSGSGKSTLLNMLAGLLTPTSGQIAYDGRVYEGFNDRDISEVRNTRIGFIPQGRSLLNNFSVLDNVALPFYLFKREGNPWELASVLLKNLGIAHLASMYPAQLSGGESRRVAIARALINTPGILIADEPTGDLDTETTKDIMALFGYIVEKGTAVLLVTHDPAAASYGKRQLKMALGRLTEEPLSVL